MYEKIKIIGVKISELLKDYDLQIRNVNEY